MLGSMKPRGCFRRWQAVLAAACSLLSAAVLPAAAQQRYPLLVQPEELRKIGIAFRYVGLDPVFIPVDIKPLEHKCYRTRFEEMSISEDMLDHYRAKGFTLHTLCLSLKTDTSLLYHPETGKRLASVQPLFYMHEKGKVVLSTNLSSNWQGVIPIEIPDCMRDGKMYRDCNVQFDILTGKRLTTKARNALGGHIARFEACVGRIQAKLKTRRQCTCEEIAGILDDAYEKVGVCVVDTLPRCPALKSQSAFDVGTLVSDAWLLEHECRGGEMLDENHIVRIDFNPEIPGGFGYGMGVSGIGAPDPSPMDEKHPSAVKRRATDSRLAAAAPWFRRVLPGRKK